MFNQKVKRSKSFYFKLSLVLILLACHFLTASEWFVSSFFVSFDVVFSANMMVFPLTLALIFSLVMDKFDFKYRKTFYITFFGLLLFIFLLTLFAESMDGNVLGHFAQNLIIFAAPIFVMIAILPSIILIFLLGWGVSKLIFSLATLIALFLAPTLIAYYYTKFTRLDIEKGRSCREYFLYGVGIYLAFVIFVTSFLV